LWDRIVALFDFGLWFLICTVLMLCVCDEVVAGASDLQFWHELWYCVTGFCSCNCAGSFLVKLFSDCVLCRFFVMNLRRFCMFCRLYL